MPIPEDKDLDTLDKNMANTCETIKKLGGLAIKCAMVGRMDVVFRIRSAFDGFVKTAEATGSVLDGLVALKDQFDGGQ